MDVPFRIARCSSAVAAAMAFHRLEFVHAYIVIGATFLSYICVMIGQKNLRPTLVGMYNYVQPVVACAIGIMLGLDTFTAIKILAVALIFSGVYLVNISKAAS